MPQQKRTRQQERAAKQVHEMRKLYARIGEPLPLDTMVDLYRHVGKALEAVQTDPQPKKKRNIDA